MIYIKDNPKLVEYCFDFEGRETFTVATNGHNTIAYYLNGKRHREDGPAVEHGDGSKYWFVNGKRHREDGPAIEFYKRGKRWCLNDEYYGYNNDFTKESWIRFVKLQLLK